MAGARQRVPLHRLEVAAPHRLPFAISTFDTIGPLSRAAFPHRHTFRGCDRLNRGPERPRRRASTGGGVGGGGQEDTGTAVTTRLLR